MVDVPSDVLAANSAGRSRGRSISTIRDSWWTRVCLLAGCQDHCDPVLRCTAMAIGMVALVLSWLMRLQLGFPGTFSFIDAEPVSSVHHHAWHDHGDLPSHGAVSRRLRELSHPADGRCSRHGVPLCEHAELLDLSACRAGAGCDLLCTRRADRRWLDAVSAAGHSFRQPRTGSRHHHDAGVADPVHYRLHHGRLELRRDGAAGSHARNDADAAAFDGVGHFYRDRDGACSHFQPCSSPR